MYLSPRRVTWRLSGRAFKDVIDELNSGFGDGAGMKFAPLGWEDTLATTGRRSQSETIRGQVCC